MRYQMQALLRSSLYPLPPVPLQISRQQRARTGGLRIAAL